MSDSAIAVFTGRSVETILREGGSGDWKVKRASALQRRYLVCCRSAVGWVQGNEPKGSAFLVGRISDVVRASETPGRWLIQISEYAEVDISDVWQGWRNPVHYTDLKTLGIDADALAFKPMPKARTTQKAVAAAKSNGKIGPLTISQAKRGLAENFGVSEKAIEITIRG